MAVMLAGGDRDCYGVGMDANIVTASIRALLSGVDRLLGDRPR
jgi:2-isopropylmalate synthase